MSAICAAVRKLEKRMRESDSLLCVGLDPVMEKTPSRLRSERFPLFAFCREMVDATAPYACAFKPNTAFFEAHGADGWAQLAMLFAHMQQHWPEHFTVCDSKRADIGNTNNGYARSVFDELGADSITLHPYLGAEALAPFLAHEDKVSVVLCRTSNAGAGEFQDLDIGGRPLWSHVAEHVSNTWNELGNCMLVVGATYPDEMRQIRALAPAMTFLVPGIGAQGGDLEATVRAGLRSDGLGLLLSSSRAILYADDPAEAARQTRDAIRSAKELYAAR